MHTQICFLNITIKVRCIEIVVVKIMFNKHLFGPDTTQFSTSYLQKLLTMIFQIISSIFFFI